MKLYFWILGIAFCFETVTGISQKRVDHVNPFIGSANFGTTNPGAIVPNGMASVVPFNVTGSDRNRWDKDKRWWSTPYSRDNEYFTGYSHVNLSGVGCPDLGVILLMPATGTLTADLKKYRSVMSGQEASPGYYSCKLDKYNILTEATATQRVGVSRFTFPEGTSHLLIDLGNGLTNESGGVVRVVNSTEIEGWRTVGNFCYGGRTERLVYFVARFSKAATRHGVWKKMPRLNAESAWVDTNGDFRYYDNSMEQVAGDSVGAYMTYETVEGEEVIVKIGISYVSMENARENLETEMPDNDFDRAVERASDAWEEVLSRVEVSGGTEDQKSMFYTALYHCNIHPNVFHDVNGEYPLMESGGKGQLSSGESRYTTFSLWDTYRNVHPLLSLIYPDKQLSMVRSILGMYRESGWLPKWELNGKETYTMNGDPVFPVLADTYLRGLTDFDIDLAYEAMYKHATTAGHQNKIRPNQDFYLKNGYMPLLEEFDNSVSVALEYYLAEWNLGQLALKLDKKKDYRRFYNQSLNYKLYFDAKEYGTFRPRLPDGSFYASFDPLQGENFEPVPGFHEGTAWQYTFGAPHDIRNLIKLMGGEKKFVEKLQKVFDEGLFDMANEPDIHYPYLFNYVKGEEWRAQKETRKLIDEYFRNTPDGLPGNDDCGTMSAWLAFTMMGLYPVCPGDMDFAIAQPVFDKVVIHLDSRYYPGEATVSIVRKTSDSDKSINKILWNGDPLPNFFIDHHELVKGGTLEIIDSP